MTEGSRGVASAGALLRAARESQGLHIAALAAAIKVAPRKLDALENDRWQDLPDATFARALAQTVCRTLKIESKPVLDLMPRSETAALESVSGHMNTPFRDRPGRAGISGGAGSVASAIRPMVWAGAALMLAALLVYAAPDQWLAAVFSPFTSTPVSAAAPAATSNPTPLPASLPASAGLPTQAAAAAELPGSAAEAALNAASASAVDASSAVPLAAAAAATPPTKSATGETVFLAPAPGTSAAAAASTAASTAAVGPVRVRTSAASWVDVRDAKNQVLLSRVVQPGETVGLDGTLPIRVTIGNAAVTQIEFRGQPVDLAKVTRENIARVELK
jgi:cytoskeleton protein RodZ